MMGGQKGQEQDDREKREKESDALEKTKTKGWRIWCGK